MCLQSTVTKSWANLGGRLQYTYFAHQAVQPCKKIHSQFPRFYAIKTLTLVTELLNVVVKQWFTSTYTFCESMGLCT
jgi:hypothetical protein